MKILIHSTTLDGEPIPGSGETIQAAEFLTRLARHGLIEFLPDDKASDPWPD